jgi:hypothetical protein
VGGESEVLRMLMYEFVLDCCNDNTPIGNVNRGFGSSQRGPKRLVMNGNVTGPHFYLSGTTSI